jgi:hypothetical protein
MARIERRLHEELTGDAPLVALVGARIWKGRADQGAEFPFVVFARIASRPTYSLDGCSGLENGVFSIEAVSDDQDQAEDVAVLVRDALDGATAIRAIRTNERTLWDDSREAWRVIMDFSIWKRGSK